MRLRHWLCLFASTVTESDPHRSVVLWPCGRVFSHSLILRLLQNPGATGARVRLLRQHSPLSAAFSAAFSDVVFINRADYEADLADVFSQFGEVVTCNVRIRKVAEETGESIVTRAKHRVVITAKVYKQHKNKWCRAMLKETAYGILCFALKIMDFVLK